MFAQYITPDALQASRIGLITDVDGTISPIVNTPSAAQVTPQARARLRELQNIITLVAVISGRAAVDVRDRVGIAKLVYVGNHGMERWNGQTVESPPRCSSSALK